MRTNNVICGVEHKDFDSLVIIFRQAKFDPNTFFSLLGQFNSHAHTEIGVYKSITGPKKKV